MMYLLTEQEHAQIVEALTNDGTHEDGCPYSNDCFNDDCDHCAPIRDMRTTLALAMLKAMETVEPCGWTSASWLSNPHAGHFSAKRTDCFNVPLYAKEQQC